MSPARVRYEDVQDYGVKSGAEIYNEHPNLVVRILEVAGWSGDSGPVYLLEKLVEIHAWGMQSLMCFKTSFPKHLVTTDVSAIGL